MSDNEPDDATDDESVLDKMRDSGVGVADPNIVGEPEPDLVDDQVADDEPPKV